MREKYLVISYGLSKKGKEQTRLAKIIEYEREGMTYAFIDTKNVKYIEGIYEIGEILELVTTVVE